MQLWRSPRRAPGGRAWHFHADALIRGLKSRLPEAARPIPESGLEARRPKRAAQPPGFESARPIPAAADPGLRSRPAGLRARPSILCAARLSPELSQSGPEPTRRASTPGRRAHGLQRIRHPHGAFVMRTPHSPSARRIRRPHGAFVMRTAHSSSVRRIRHPYGAFVVRTAYSSGSQVPPQNVSQQRSFHQAPSGKRTRPRPHSTCFPLRSSRCYETFRRYTQAKRYRHSFLWCCRLPICAYAGWSCCSSVVAIVRRRAVPSSRGGCVVPDAPYLILPPRPPRLCGESPMPSGRGTCCC